MCYSFEHSLVSFLSVSICGVVALALPIKGKPTWAIHQPMIGCLMLFNCFIVKVGWECIQCTYINEPTRPACMICLNDRPENYVVPGIKYKMSEEERIRLKKEKQQERQLKEVFN